MTDRPSPPPPSSGDGARARVRRETWRDVVVLGLAELLVPWAARDAQSRVFWGALLLAALVGLSPDERALGTALPEHRYALVGAALLLAVVAFVSRRIAAGPRAAVTASLVVAGVAAVAGGLVWAVGCPAFVAGTLLLSARRRETPRPLPLFEADPLPPTPGGLPSLLTRIASTVVVVLVLREFVLEARNVPTASMQPTIMGDRPPAASGDHVLVDRAAYLLRDPERWEIVVFRYPLLPSVTFVKRVVGLPGETLDLRDGDVYVNGVLVAKPSRVQESLWQTAFPTSTRSQVVGTWDGSEDDGWRIEDDVPVVKPRGGRPAYLAYKRRLKPADVRVTARVEPRGDAGHVLLGVSSRGRDVTLRLPFGTTTEQGGTLLVEGAEPVPVAARLSGPAAVRLAAIDGRVRVDVDGREVLDVAMDATGTGKTGVRVGADGGEVRFGALRVETDLEYVTRGVLTHFEIPDDGYVMLGDNSTGSEDSRIWTATEFVVEGDGPTIVATPSAPDPSSGAPKANIVTAGGITRFVDVDGVEHELPATSVLKRREVSRPIVRRSHLLGRASAILWPWIVHEAGFRPRILP